MVYVNLDNLNQVTFLILKFGSAWLLVVAFFFVKYFIKLYTNVRYFIKIQRKLFKWTATIVLLILLFFAYQNKDSLVDKIIDSYEGINFEEVYPFSFSLGHFIPVLVNTPQFCCDWEFYCKFSCF